MNNALIDMLNGIESPSRYLGTEINRIRKDHSQMRLTVALAFPDLYDIGTSHFGIQILYHILNRQKDIVAERVFAPDVDMDNRLRSEQKPLVSLETKTPLNKFDIIGFSLLYEMNYTNILSMLDLCGIPFLSKDRDNIYPLIIAGGPCTCNPEPIADIFDAIVIGDGESVIVDMANALMEFKESRETDKSKILKQWSKISGVYIPSFFKPMFDEFGFQKITSTWSDCQIITRAVVSDLNDAPFPTHPIVPFGKPVHDRLRIEIARGCSRGCRFCQAGMLYRPVRERYPQSLIQLINQSLNATGYEELSLLSLSSGDYGCIGWLMEQIMAAYADAQVAVSLPSLRVGTLTPELMSLIKKVRKTGFTIAPEAGSQKLRNVINKNLSDEEIIQTVTDAFRLGWQTIKLYFMIGLPKETESDLEAIVEMAKRLKKIKTPNNRRGKLNVSISTFIPKPHTPFQWASQMSLQESKEKLRWLQDHLKMSGIDLKWQKPEVSYLEGLWARGDRRLANLLIRAYSKGCRFDGWTDKFRFSLWEQAISEENIDVGFFTTRSRTTTEPLPWDHIDIRVKKEFLIEEWQKALNETTTSDCRFSTCHSCGVCDFKTIQPIFFNESEMKTQSSMSRNAILTRPISPQTFHLMKIIYSKTDQAKYFGHLELLNIMMRAFRRSGIFIQHSEGFHPMPKLSFDDALPVGMESLNSVMYAQVDASIDPETVMNRLNQNLPEGLHIHRCEVALHKKDASNPKTDTYEVSFQTSSFNPSCIEKYHQLPEFVMIHTTRKGNIRQINLKEKIQSIEMIDPNRLKISIVSEQGFLLRPTEVIRKIFNLSDQDLPYLKIVKL